MGTDVVGRAATRRAALLAAVLFALLPAVSPTAAFALAPGDHSISIGERGYMVHVPVKLAGQPALVLNFHGGGGNPIAQQKYARMDRLADREGFIVVYPEGTGPIDGKLLTWNAGTCCGSASRDRVDDVGYVRRLLDDLARRHAYDRARVYATGFSNGAMMSYRLAAELSERIAAIAPVAGAPVIERHATGRANPILHIHSVDDPRALYAGGLGPPFPRSNVRVQHAPVEASLALWASANGCAAVMAPGERREWNGHGATLFTYPGCRVEVLLWKLSGPGHVWPGGEPDYLPRLLGPGTAVIDANEEMWRFFSRHRLPQQ